MTIVLYTGNTGSNTVSSITEAGTVNNSFASLSSQVGNGMAAVCDSSGNLFILTSTGVSKITPSGTVSSFATGLTSPQKLVIDSSDNLYVVCATATATVAKITPSGTVTNPWATTVANGYFGIAIDSSGNVYTGSSTGVISKITPAGSVTATWATVSSFAESMCFDSSGNMYVVNTGGNTVSKITPAAVVTLTYATVGSSPTNIVCDSSNNLYVACATSPARIDKISSAGSVTTSWASFTGTTGSPQNMIIDLATGNIYVDLFSGPGKIMKVTSAGVVTNPFATVGNQPSPMAMTLAPLAILSGTSYSGSPSGSPTGTFTFTNSAPCVAIFTFDSVGVGGYCPITSVTDSAGNTWHRRSQTEYTSAYNGWFGVNTFVHEVWWANITAINSSAVTVTLNVANTATFLGTGYQVHMFGVTGSPSPTAPWEPSGYHAAEYGNNSGVATTPSAAWSAASANAMILSSLTEITTSSSSPSTIPPTGFTTISSDVVGSTNKFETGVSYLNSTGTGTASYSGTCVSWVVVNDALVGVGTGSSADVTPTTNVTGTITTSLTKAAISAAGWTTVKGTVATNLTKASQLATGAEVAVDGTITTRLTKLSQSLSGQEKFVVNTMDTALSKLSQSAGGWTTIRGTITTSLSKVNMQATDVEVFTGTITTALPAHSVLLEARTFEVFSGTITTNLSPFKMAQSLVAEEDFVGTIVTRLGGENGQGIGNVVQALEIIEGPITMQLQPFRPLILGAQLGTPGAGKWFSYRYMDS
jgi:hypothetical protein